MGEKKRESRSYGLQKKLLLYVMIPIGILLAVFYIVIFHSFQQTINNEVAVELENVAGLVEDQMDLQYPGDYSENDQNGIVILKGTQILNENNTLVDSIKEKYSVDVTFFYNDMRILTTLRDQDGNRLTATQAPIKVIKEVYSQNQSRFYKNVKVYDDDYYAYYKPITNSDGTCCGMICIGKPSGTVYKRLLSSLIPVIVIGVLGLVSIAMISGQFITAIVGHMSMIKKMLADISVGKLNGYLDTEVLARKDEIGDIAKSVVKMQSSIRDMVEQDALTQIYNRRRGEAKLQETIRKGKAENMLFSVAIGDIDLFKRVNDTYGHEAGDRVLQKVAMLMKRLVSNHGYVARWGGEEFMIVFENMEYEEAQNRLQDILEEIRNMKVIIEEDKTIQVTMTFGIVSGDKEAGETNLKRADELLYKGKENGRNQIVSSDDV